jgi:hypothetical protein
MRNTATTDNAVQNHYQIIDVKIMVLARLEGGSCMRNTATTDNAVQKHYLNVYRFIPSAAITASCS